MNHKLRKKVAQLTLMGLVLAFSLPLYAQTINLEDIAKGVVHVTYKGTAGKRIKVLVDKDGTRYNYNLNEEGKTESFPLQLGNGTYKISVMEQTVDNKYRQVATESLTLNMENPNDVYLNAIQSIAWDESMEPIQFASARTEGLAIEGTTTTLYQDMITQYGYDYAKLMNLPSNYIPMIESTFLVKTGICYDFSSLYASMLRSQGVPVKLVKGYTPNAEGYHAWNEVYDAKTGEWHVIDTTYDLQATGKKVVVQMIKPTQDYQKVYEY